MFTSKTTKTELQAAVEKLEKEVAAQGEIIESLNGKLDRSKSENERKGREIAALNEAVSGTRDERDKARQEAREHKRELDGLKDTKTVLDKLMSILRSPHNDYQKVVDQLNDMLQQERSRADALEQELRAIQFEIQHNKFLDGKVQAYETVLNTRPLGGDGYCRADNELNQQPLHQDR